MGKMAYKIKQSVYDTHDISSELHSKLDDGAEILYHQNYSGIHPTEICITNNNLLIAEKYQLYPIRSSSPIYVEKINLYDIEKITKRYSINLFAAKWLLSRLLFSVVALIIFIIYFRNSLSNLEFIMILLVILVPYIIVVVYLGRCIEISIMVRNQSKPVKVRLYGLKQKKEAEIILKHLQRSEAPA